MLKPVLIFGSDRYCSSSTDDDLDSVTTCDSCRTPLISPTGTAALRRMMPTISSAVPSLPPSKSIAVVDTVRGQKKQREVNALGAQGLAMQMQPVPLDEHDTRLPAGVTAFLRPVVLRIHANRKRRFGFYTCVFCLVFVARLRRCLRHRTSFESQKLKLMELRELYDKKYSEVGKEMDNRERVRMGSIRKMNVAFRGHLKTSNKEVLKARTGKQTHDTRDVPSSLSVGPNQTPQQIQLANFLPNVRTSSLNSSQPTQTPQLPQQSMNNVRGGSSVTPTSLSHHQNITTHSSFKQDEFVIRTQLPFLNLNVSFEDTPMETNILRSMSTRYLPQSVVSKNLQSFVNAHISVNPDDRLFPIHSEANVFPSFQSQLVDEVKSFTERTTKEIARLVKVTASTYDKKRKCLFQNIGTTTQLCDLRASVTKETKREMQSQAIAYRIRNNIRWFDDFLSRLTQCAPPEGFHEHVEKVLRLLRPCYQENTLTRDSFIKNVLSGLKEDELLDLDVQFVLYHCSHTFCLTKQNVGDILLREFHVPSLVLDPEVKQRLDHYDEMEPTKVDKDRRARHVRKAITLRENMERMFTSVTKDYKIPQPPPPLHHSTSQHLMPTGGFRRLSKVGAA